MPDEFVNVRYVVDDVETAVAFYTTHFGFTPRSSSAPAFADVGRGQLRLLLVDAQGHRGVSIELSVKGVDDGNGEPVSHR